MIDQRADVHPQAKIADGVTIGPWAVIGADVEIGEGTWIGPHVFIKGPTRIGCHNKIYQFSSIGEDPQDKKYSGGKTWLEIGDHNVVREFCTINRGTEQGGGITRIGNHNLFMSYVHIAHDCEVGDHTIFANNASLAGHVIINDYATLGGFSGVHQFCVIGKYSFVAKGTLLSKDVLPYVLVSGHEAAACGLNLVGLKRHGFDNNTLNQLRRAYKIIYRQGLTVAQSLKQLQELVQECPAVQLMIDALSQSTRGIVR